MWLAVTFLATMDRCPVEYTGIRCAKEAISLTRRGVEEETGNFDYSLTHTIANIYYSNNYLTVLIWTTVSETDTTTRHFYARLLNWMTEILLLEICTIIAISRHGTCCYLTLLFSCSLYFEYFNFCIFYWGDWKCGTGKRGTIKNAGVENAGLENAGQNDGWKTWDWKTQDHLTGVENARPTVMERRMYKKSKEDEAFIAQWRP